MNNEEEFEKAINNLVALAHAELHAFTDRLDYSKPFECKQATLEFMRYLGKKYEQACQEVARLEYVALRGGAEDGFIAESYQGLSDKDFLNSVDYYCKFLFGDVEDE